MASSTTHHRALTLELAKLLVNALRRRSQHPRLRTTGEAAANSVIAVRIGGGITPGGYPCRGCR